MVEEVTRRTSPEPVWVLGLPLSPLTFAQVEDEVVNLIEAGRPSYLVTANLNYAMLNQQDEALREATRRAALIVADGMPLVWASRRKATPLPERVAGSDLIFALNRLAADRGYRVYFLGGRPGVADEAARRLTELYPGLNVVGADSPPFREPTPEEHAALVARIHAARPDILILSFSQPKGEVWIARNFQELGVPFCIQLGASLDFAAGRVRRAPRWLQRTGLEWAFRLWLEPRRLASRYVRNGVYLLKLAASRHVMNGKRLRPRAASEGSL